MNKFFAVGSDPEVFLKNKEGVLVSAIGIIPGSKKEPHKTAHGSIQPDNILAEFNSRPSSSLEEFIMNHRLIINDLEDVIKPLDLYLDFSACLEASESILNHPDAIMVGCEPDFCAWTGLKNKKANYLFDNRRAAGGHLHISFDQSREHAENRVRFVKALDLVLGVPSVLMDEDTQRRQFYGKAGSFRPKVEKRDGYDGVEYRSLSNFWLKSDELLAWAYMGVESVYSNLSDWTELAEDNQVDIQRAINDSDKKIAEKLVNYFDLKVA